MSVESVPHLTSGSQLGHYVIRRRLGAGGMGEVYEADDTRLRRRVAIKVVRRDVAQDPVRRARLEREATAVAALNHPHVVTVHSLEEHGDTLFLTMELIDGSTLADVIPAEGLAVERLLRLAVQIADALGGAHAAGVVHRDLKPANIMLTREGSIKVLDFGLSRLTLEETQTTLSTDRLSSDGTLVGTAPYLSPEQIDGSPADSRSDIFSLGVVLFEMATGRRPFSGPTMLATLSAISKDTPPLASSVNPSVPDELAWTIDRCLAKDPTARMQSAVDLRGRLEDLARVLESGRHIARGAHRTQAADRPARARRVAAPLLAAGILALAGAFWFWPGPAGPPANPRVARFTIELPAAHAMYSGFNPLLAFSPDGTQLAMTPLPGPVFVRHLRELESRALESTTSPGWRDAPLFSPDGQFVSFIDGNAIASSIRPFYKAAVSGGAPVKLADYDAFHRGDWSADGWIYWTAQYPGGLVRIPEGGGEIQPVTELDLQRGERSHRFARLLPGGHALVFVVASDGMATYDEARINLLDLRTRERKTLVDGGTSPAYSPSGHIIYARAGKLMALPFDLPRLAVTGTPFEVLDGVLMSSNTGAAQFALSARGDLAYVPGTAEGARRSLVWVDRNGREEPLPLEPAAYLYPAISPDGRFVALEIEGPNHDFYVYDTARAVLTKMTTDGQSHHPVWSPEGARIAFRSWIAGGMTLWMMPSDRSAPAARLDPSGTRQSPVSFSPDGRFLTFDQKDPETGDDAWVLPLDGGSPVSLARTRFGEGAAKFSPDGRWVAYASNESGRSEVYVQAFPGPGPRTQISSRGGYDPVWRRSGRELYYRDETGMMVVSIATAPGFQASAPKRLWEGRYVSGSGSSCGMPGVSSSNYDVTADGERFLMVRDADDWLAGNRVITVLDWASEIPRQARATGVNARAERDGGSRRR